MGCNYVSLPWILASCSQVLICKHDDVIKWKHFPRYWPFVRGIHRSPVNSPHKGQWRWPLIFSLICVWINRWVNNREAGDLRRNQAHCDVIVMVSRLTNETKCHNIYDFASTTEIRVLKSVLQPVLLFDFDTQLKMHRTPGTKPLLFKHKLIDWIITMHW